MSGVFQSPVVVAGGGLEGTTMAEDTSRVLQLARDILNQGWCQRTMAVDADGVACGTFDSCAVKWCARGAIYVAARAAGVTSESALHALTTVVRRPITEWNDEPDRTGCQVLDAFDEAIQSVKGGA